MKKRIIYPLALGLLCSSALVVKNSEAAIPFFSAESTPQQGMPTLAPILKEVTPAVVNISTKSKVEVAAINPMFNDPFFNQFFNIPQMQQQQPQQKQQREVQSAGSGVIIDAGKGYVLTNNHVIKGADEIYVSLKDKRRLKAKLVGTDEATDIAVLKIDSGNLTAIKLASGLPEVGDFVLAIGNPFGIGQTVTSGIVSALGRNGLGIEGYENFIQTDASINPGNSGGALINLKGELVGINTAILSKSGGNVGIGFAIPVSMASQVMNQLIDHGSIERGQLGIHIQDVTPEISEAMGISVNEGALVSKIEKDSSAEKAGFKEGDVVIKFNGEAIGGSSDLKNKVGMLAIGQKVTMEVMRDGKSKTLTATIGKTKQVSGAAVEADAPLLKGITLSSVADGSKTEGVLVKAIEDNSPAASVGLKVGDIITSVNKQKVTSPEDVIKAAKASKKTLLINITRGDSSMFIVIQR